MNICLGEFLELRAFLVTFFAGKKVTKIDLVIIVNKMFDWKYTFDPISKATWLKQIEADLYPRALDSIQSEWWPGEPMFPAHQLEDRQDPVSLPNSLFEQPPQIMEWIDTTIDDAKTTNKKILDALNYGAQSLVLHVDPNKKMSFRLWLDGVLSDMVELSVCLDQESPEIIHAIREIIPQSSLIRLLRKNTSQPSSVFLEPLQGSMDETAKLFRYVYEIPSSGSWTSQTAEIFRLILQDLTYWASQGLNFIDFLDNCVLLFTPDTQYFKQIIQTRVLHLVWNNLWSLYTKSDGISSSSYLECHIDKDESVDPDQYIIRSSVSALAASLTGVHALCIHHLHEVDIPAFYNRIDRNIHHLLNLESEMYKGTDPLAGSYSLDYYTRRWTEDIWTQVSKINY